MEVVSECQASKEDCWSHTRLLMDLRDVIELEGRDSFAVRCTQKWSVWSYLCACFPFLVEEE